MNVYLIFILTSAIVGLACAAAATRYGKDPVRWFVVGVVLNVLALAAIMIAGGRRVDRDTGRST